MRRKIVLVKLSLVWLLGGALLALTMLMILGMARGGGVLAQEERAPVSPATVWIAPPASSVYPDDEFSVTVRISDTTDLGGYEFSMDFDPDVITVTNVVDAGWLDDTGRTVYAPPADIVPGMVTFAASSMGTQPGVEGDGPLAIVTLEAVGVGTSTLYLHDVTIADTNAQEETPATEDGTVEVVSSSAYQIFLPFVARAYTP